ncbi:MAG: hypothetical protein PUP91_33930 [Rhizonema sp. PD37]|nr:hypothetical protein [Rhizonema sp. PD37]
MRLTKLPSIKIVGQPANFYCVIASSKTPKHLSSVVRVSASQILSFIDFTPYPGCRLVIANVKKFESLPEDVEVVVSLQLRAVVLILRFERSQTVIS